MVFSGTISVIVTSGVLVSECELNCVTTVLSINIVGRDLLEDETTVESMDCPSEGVGEMIPCEVLITWFEPVASGCVLRYVAEMLAESSVVATSGRL